MLIIRNNIIPFQGFKLINLFGILFVRKNATLSDVDINHEAIHTAQIREMLYIFFYLWYAIEWLIRFIFITNEAYENTAFEVEAYKHQDDLDYLKHRKLYSWFKYL